MITSPQPNNKKKTKENNRKAEGLTQLKGIGSVKQQWLKECLNINTVQELANLSVDAIESQLKARGQMVSKSEIENWISQAQELVALEQRASQPIVESVQQESEKPLNLVTLEAQADLPSATVAEAILAPSEEGWRTFASFTVEFQSKSTDGKIEEQRTTVRHLEANQVETWFGIEREKLGKWIITKLNEVKPLSSEASLDQSRASVLCPIKLEIDQIRLWQPPQTKTPVVFDHTNQLFPAIIRCDQPFTLEVDLKLAELNASHSLKRPIGCLVQGYVRDRATRAITSLGETMLDTLEAGQSSHTVMLATTTLQQPGMYCLQVLGTLQGIPATPAYFEIPLLQIV